MSLPPARPELSDPRLSALYDYWMGKCAGRPMPARADIDPLEMRAWLGHLLLIEVMPAGGFVYRLYGTAFADSFGVDMTGKSVDDLPAEQQDRVRFEYEIVRDSRRPRSRIYTGRFDAAQHLGTAHRGEAQVATWERLVLPLSDDGDRVAMLLVGAFALADLRPSNA